MNKTSFNETTFGEFISIQRGHDLPQNSRVEGSIPVAGSSGVVGFHNEGRGLIPGITIGRSGSIGVVNFYSDDYFPLNTVLYVTDFKGNDPKFVYYFLKTLDFLSFNSGSVQPSLNRNLLYPARVKLPSVQIQKSIAHILGNLDEKIELNQKMNETLEEIAKTIFKSWFVDFDPVRAKMEGRPTGLPGDISELFPDELVDSEIGDIPRGWEISVISDFGNVVCGKTPSTKDPENFDGVYPFITIPDMRGNILSLETDRTISDKGAQLLKGKLLPAGSICVSCIATPGLVCVTTTDSFTNQQINSIVPQVDQHKEYLAFSMMTFGDLISSAGSGGSVFANLSTGRFKELPILRPVEGIVSAFSNIICPILERVGLAQSENSVLSELRDTLLPKLISGELQIPDAEKFLEESGI